MKVLYFAWVREVTGTAEEEFDLAEGVNTVQDLVSWLKEKDLVYQQAFADDKMVRVAVNQEYVNLDHLISNNDEIAFFPPVTGG